MSKSRTEVLQDIIASTKKLAGRGPQHTIHPYVTIDDFDTPPLSLTSITLRFGVKLSRHDIPPQIRQKAVSRASEVATVYQQSFSKSCQRLISASQMDSSPIYPAETIQNLRETMEHLYEHKELTKFFDVAMNARLRVSQTESPTTTTRRESKPFNHRFTYFLEGYFEQNAFPSVADRKLLAEKGDMTPRQIEVWFQNHRNRSRSQGITLKKPPSGQTVNEDLIKHLEDFRDSPSIHSPAESDDEVDDESFLVDLDDLVRTSEESIARTYESKAIEYCTSDMGAFGFSKTNRTQQLERPSTKIDDLHTDFGSFTIRAGPVTSAGPSKVTKSKTKSGSSTGTTPKAAARSKPFKATLRSCFSAAITLTCPRPHPALIRQKDNLPSTLLSTEKLTVLEQKRVPVQPYTMPAVLPTWELPATHEVEHRPIRRKKPTIPSHGGKARPGSPYPQQTISRMSSASSLASIASDDSQSSSRSTSSTFSTSTVESSQLSTPAQSPSPDNAELLDDARFGDDMFGDYLFYSNPMPDNFFFDINVDEPFDKDVSLSVAEFDKSVSLSIAEFETTTLPSFDFFES